MAQIYQSQLMHKSTESKPFKVDPIKDYIADGLRNLATASDNAMEAINRVKDEKMAGDMAAAAQQSAKIIDEWQDFTSANYMEQLEQAALKPWYDALKTADGPTQTRFLRNNPESEEIFKLKVSEDVVKKVQAHVYATRMAEIPKASAQAVSAYNPLAVRSSSDPEATSRSMITQAINNMKAHVNYMQENSKMDPIQLKEYLIKYQHATARGLVATLIAADDYKGALAANASLAGILSPEEMAQYDTSIQALMKQATSSSSSGSGGITAGSIEDNLVEGLVAALSRIQEDNNLSDDVKRSRINGLLTFAKDGKLSLEKAQRLGMVPEMEIISPLGAYDLDVRNKIAAEAYKRFSHENDFVTGVNGIVGELKYNYGNLISAVKGKNFDEWNRDDLMVAVRLNNDTKQFQSYHSSLGEISAPIEAGIAQNVRGAADYLDSFTKGYKTEMVKFRYSGTARIGTYLDKNPRLVVEENLTKAAMDDMREKPMDVYDEALMQNVADISLPFSQTIQGGKEDFVEGSYAQGISYTGGILYSLPIEMKTALGIDKVGTEQLVYGVLTVAANKDAEGLLDAAVDENNPLESYPGFKEGGVEKIKDLAEKDLARANELVKGAAVINGNELKRILDRGFVEMRDGKLVPSSRYMSSLTENVDTSNYLTLVYEVVQTINPAAQIDEATAKTVASILRKVTFNGMEGVPLDELVRQEEARPVDKPNQAIHLRELAVTNKGQIPELKKD
jgi:hypothetical protein